MKAATKKLTEKEAEIMNLLWAHGALSVREMLGYYGEPKPHFNTVSTTVRILEDKGYVSHESGGGAYRYSAVAGPEAFRSRSLAGVVRRYFNNSYASVVSALAEEEKISADELRDIIKMIEQRSKSKQS